MLVDRAATPAKLSDQDIASWAASERVFISSVMDELSAERAAVAEAVADIGAEPVRFEDFGGRDDDAHQAYLTEVAASTIYLGILGRTYGRLLPSRLSATHTEYREAERLGLRVSAWVRADDDRQGDQQTFLDEVRAFHTTGSFTEPDF